MKFSILLLVNALIFQGVKSSSNVDVDVIVNVNSGMGAKEDYSPEMIKPTPKPVVPCGIPNRQLTRIVGGNATEVNEYPWQVALAYDLGYTYWFYCGGTIITERWVMTAAHCDPWLSDFVVVGGHEVGSNQSSPFYQRINISEVHRHERYHHTKLDNDIALVKLAEDLIFNEGVAPVCLPRRKQDQDFYDGFSATVIGFGLTEFNTSNLPEELQEVDINVVPLDECLMLYETAELGPLPVTENMICAGPEEGLKGSCQGDSGGPLMITESVEDVYTQIGIVSWANECGTPEYPTVFARVDRFLNWIKERTGYIYHRQ